MKKFTRLLCLLVSVFLLLCACTQEQADQASSNPDTLSSAPDSSTPDSSTPASSPAASTPPPTQLSDDWMVKDRTIVPFAERFETDAPFSFVPQAYYSGDTSWLAQGADGSYGRYTLGKKSSDPGILTVNDPYKFEDATLYEIPVEENLTEYGVLIADGHWAYLISSKDLIKVDLLSGDCTTRVTRSNHASSWQVQSCGKDTVCIFELGEGNTLRVFYRDLHSDTEKVLYEGTIPATPMEDLRFIAPETTLGEVTWQMMNPAFYAAVQAELQNPDSQFKTIQNGVYAHCWTDPENNPVSITDEPFLCIAIQDHYNIPARVKYIYNIKTGQLLEDHGIIDSCERGSGDYNDHFNYENTRETPLVVVDPNPVTISNITRLTDSQIKEDLGDEHNSASSNAYLYTSFGYAYPYWRQDNSYTKVADILIREITASPHYLYGITPDNTIVQLSQDGSICNTIYTSDNVLEDICYHAGSVYFKDGTKIIRINAITGTYSVILQCDGTMRLDAFGSEEKLYILVVQGLYNQQYFFDPDTGVLKETGFI